MTQLKHVLVLTILILPMFALAPSLVTVSNTTLSGPASVDNALPAQFVEETLRVAVYVEDEISLPAYAEGGEYTANYANIIQFLEAEGFSVTPITTQDIYDRQLLAARFDAFVLPNQLPRANITNHVKDFWLAGGGILSIGNSLGYLLYMGMIAPTLEGDFGWVGVGSPPYYLVNNTYDAVRIVERHPVTKGFAVDDLIPYTENTAVWNWIDFEGFLGDSFFTLGKHEGVAENGAIFALDDSSQGGKIVQIPGDLSSIPAWQHPLIVDSIDWLAPRPKGRILFDLAHNNYLPIDPWDPMHEYYPLESWRNGMVNHSYTVDKLHSEVTLAKLAHYDMFVVSGPTVNFTAAESEALRSWVEDGGGLFVIGDYYSNMDEVANDVLTPFDISFNLTTGSTGFGATCVPTVELHPLHENALYLEYGDGAFLNVTGDAYPLWYYDGNIVGAGQEYGEGRVIVSSDVNFAGDGLEAHLQDNYQYLLNVANWLTAAKAKILVYADHGSDPRDPNLVPINGPVAQALNDLGLPFYISSVNLYFNKSLFYQQWDMVIFDNIASWTGPYQPHLMDFVENGGKLILSTYSLAPAIAPYFGIETWDYFDAMPPEVFFWDYAHPMFNLPAPYGLDHVNSTMDIFGGFGTYALNFTTYANATTYAGYSASPDGGAGIIVGANGRAIMNGPLITCYGEDIDDSTYPDNFELWTNQIGYLYFERPNIDHPDDVTYMETETGNEIIWHPTAQAGPWEYVFRVNGTPVEGGRWSGASLAFNIDGVNVSITEYELEIFDRLGYSIFDRVTLNVTEYVEPTPPPGPGLDPTLLIIIGAAVAGVVIILIVVMQLKKKK